MKIKTMGYKLVKFIPEKLENGILYISKPYMTAAHKCCCGCEEEVITPLNPTDWSVRISNNLVSMSPSIGNWSFACRSHYWIRNGKTERSYQMSEQEIQRGRTADKNIKDIYFNEANLKKQQLGNASTRQLERKHTNWVDKLLAKLKSWFET